MMMESQQVQMLCPRTRDNMTIQNFVTNSNGRTFRLSIEKCNPDKMEGCERDKRKTDDFVNNLQVLSYGLFDQI